MKLEEIALVNTMLDRADEIWDELEITYERDLNERQVSNKALNLTHEIVEKCSNALDQVMTVIFNHDIKPLIAEMPKRNGYFPVAKDENSYRSSMGNWNATNLEKINPELDMKIRATQPFINPSFKILLRLREISNKKHTGLIPQVKSTERRVTVAHQGNSISWTPNMVTFGQGVSVFGVPIDPNTQMPKPNQNISAKVDIWVSFHLKDGGENALLFCKECIDTTRKVVAHVSS